ncbi:fasciclin domain-containing protein [Novosphingopyxis sp. YJ-S2-01]|uniref:fasciclin domain-containing protein n=1 Tax=Novosphingopyxis sp. YJ-S2-01 TaxID=2794021 RepID=UPI0018DC3FCB|nr:fasciclin domain-containing protein [Novosphingopyxis sp. YJ-S2-01]
MKKTMAIAAAALAASLAGCQNMGMMDDGMSTTASASANSTVMVGGAAMYPTRNIIQNAVNSNEHTTLVAAVKAAGLVDTLSGPGPFTVFAPTNAAFDALPAGTVDNLLMPSNKAKLQKVLTYHVVPGRITAADIAAKIRAGGGTATYTTVEGEPLTFRMNGNEIVATGVGGGTATVTQPDVMQSNGVIHVVNGVVLPRM